jgi:hypothetical protein
MQKAKAALKQLANIINHQGTPTAPVVPLLVDMLANPELADRAGLVMSAASRSPTPTLAPALFRFGRSSPHAVACWVSTAIDAHTEKRTFLAYRGPLHALVAYPKSTAVRL